jgi:hypothetical protein
VSNYLCRGWSWSFTGPAPSSRILLSEISINKIDGDYQDKPHERLDSGVNSLLMKGKGKSESFILSGKD